MGPNWAGDPPNCLWGRYGIDEQNRGRSNGALQQLPCQRAICSTLCDIGGRTSPQQTSDGGHGKRRNAGGAAGVALRPGELSVLRSGTGAIPSANYVQEIRAGAFFIQQSDTGGMRVLASSGRTEVWHPALPFARRGNNGIGQKQPTKPFCNEHRGAQLFRKFDGGHGANRRTEWRRQKHRSWMYAGVPATSRLQVRQLAAPARSADQRGIWSLFFALARSGTRLLGPRGCGLPFQDKLARPKL